MPQQVRHIVLIKLRSEVDEQVTAHVIEMLKKLGQDVPGVLEWKISKSLDTRKGNVIVENALFASQVDLKNFQDSAEHKKIGNFLKDVADWVVGDYIENA